ncbi:MAG: hypothetical protein AABY40_01140 [Nanoarchaeota archaeon]
MRALASSKHKQGTSRKKLAILLERKEQYLTLSFDEVLAYSVSYVPKIVQEQ